MSKLLLRRAVLIVVVAAIAASLPGCGGPGNFNFDDFTKIKIGMNETEVEAILGKPDSQTGGGNGLVVVDKLLFWKYSDDEITVTFTDGKVRMKSRAVLSRPHF